MLMLPLQTKENEMRGHNCMGPWASRIFMLVLYFILLGAFFK